MLPLLLLVSPAQAVTPDTQNFAQIERGKYLATLGDCVACHTAKGGKPFAGGLPIETPFGIIVSPNITPDQETGIGTWSDDDFVATMQRGVARGNEHLYPAMPYNYYTHVTRDDDLAIRAWLATLPPVHNQIVSNQLPFPFKIRAVMRVWNALFFTPGTYQPNPQKSPEWNRGAYIVTGLGHCGACHTPKNFLGGDKQSMALAGEPLQGWYAPNITNAPREGLGHWSLDEITAYLRTGHNKAAAASGPMGEEVAYSSTNMTNEDLHAIATYLKDQPGQPEPDIAAPDAAQMKLGAAIYADECSACHTPNGQGVANLFPALNNAPSIQSREATSIIRVVLEGAQSVATNPKPTGPAMPAFSWMLSDTQIAAVATYVRNAWGNHAPAVSPDAVAAERRRLGGG